ncbi:MAG: tRNA lysidine(34) synthetase TilS [Burkholderiaceae bacterium]|nr:tRNA lysidine(34) synthetase TilS [Burkholderiaceae bacterium]
MSDAGEPIEHIESIVGERLADLADGPLLLGFSAGLDSRVLLDVLVRVCGAGRIRALHVDHGLQACSGAWADRALACLRKLGVDGRYARLQAPTRAEGGIEAWARERRYEALESEARRLGASAILLAHHADDQVETLLLNLGRGAGLAGLASMPARRDVIGPGQMTGRRTPIVRPLLDVRRADILAYARARGLQWIDDPSNEDRRWRRNRLRHEVLPALESTVPGFSCNARRAVAHLQESLVLVEEIGALDLDAVRDPDGRLRRDRLRDLSEPRLANLLRHWLRQLGLRVPSRRQLAEIRRQIVDANGPHARVDFDGWRLCRHRHLVWAEPSPRTPADVSSSSLTMSAPGRVALPQWDGAIRLVRSTGEGIEWTWLGAVPIVVRPGKGRDRLRPERQAASRTLKNLYQEAGIPPALRRRLPVLERDGMLLYAAGLGANRDPAVPMEPGGAQLCFEPGASTPAAAAFTRD